MQWEHENMICVSVRKNRSMDEEWHLDLRKSLVLRTDTLARLGCGSGGLFPNPFIPLILLTPKSWVNLSLI